MMKKKKKNARRRHMHICVINIDIRGVLRSRLAVYKRRVGHPCRRLANWLGCHGERQGYPGSEAGPPTGNPHSGNSWRRRT